MSRALPLVVLVLMTLLAWAPGLSGSFHFDDLPNIVLDPATSDPALLMERLANGFRPLLRLSYALDHALWGFDARGFLATNMLIHLATVLLVWALAYRRLDDEFAAFAAAGVFALQPAHAAVVAWASGRSTGLATLFLVAALLAHEHARSRHRAWRAASLAAFTLAVLSKEVALILPAVLLLWETTQARPAPLAERLRRVAPSAMLALALLAAALAGSARLREILDFSFALSSPIESLATHAAALPVSLSLWLRPWALSVEHAASATSLAVIAGAAVLSAMIALGWRCRHSLPLVTLGLIWPLVVLLPTHSLIARLDPIVEKSLYPSWIGPSLALGGALAWLVPALGRRVALTGALGILCCLGMLSAWRAQLWADPLALWREATANAPLSARAWSNRALVELDSGQHRSASIAVARALALDPHAIKTRDLALAISFTSPLTTEAPRP